MNALANDPKELPIYERPVLLRHQMGLMNKFGRAVQSRPQTHIDDVPVADLVARYGSPLFVFSERTLVQKYRGVYQAFARRYPKVRLAWSYKTNYLQAICRVLHREGAFAEVVSPMEFDKALRTGVSADHIHFNGPYKPDAALEQAIRGGAPLHIDNFDELVRLERLADKLALPQRPRVAIRVNLAVEGLPAWSRFGLNLETGQAREAADRILSGGKLDLVGLHCHIGTFILSPVAYGLAAAKLVDLANDLRRERGLKLSFIDLGGGFASSNTLREQYLAGEQATPTPERYADAICNELARLDYAPQELPTLVLETGRALVDDAGSLISSVVATKRLPDGRRALVVDAGVNLLFTAFWYKHEVVPAQDVPGTPEPTVLYGPLCMNIDVLRDSVELPPLGVGDRVVFRHVGAYNVTQWMQFITLRPAVVLIGSGGRTAVIRRAERLDDLEALEEVPEWLR
ncbi:MAG: diaminopimelate decarboxylase [Polyangia bacterium]